MLIPNLNQKLAKNNLRGVHANGHNLIGFDDDILVKKLYGEEITEKYWSNVCALASNKKATIISYRWVSRYLNGHDNYFYNHESIIIDNTIVNLIENNLNRLAKCANSLIVIGAVPEIPFYAPNFYMTSAIKGKIERDKHDLYSSPLNAILNRLKTDENVYVLQPSDFLCDEKNCNALNKDQFSLYYDDDHLSSHGSNQLTDEIINIIISRANL